MQAESKGGTPTCSAGSQPPAIENARRIGPSFVVRTRPMLRLSTPNEEVVVAVSMPRSKLAGTAIPSCTPTDTFRLTARHT